MYNRKDALLEVKNDERWEIRYKNDVIGDIIKKAVRELSIHYGVSPVKQEDIEKNGQIMYFSLMEMCTKNNIFFPLRKRVFGMMVDFWNNIINNIPDE